MKLFKSFMNDDDGFSAKDYLMVTFGTLFILMLATAFIVSLVGVLPAATISVIGMMDGVIIAIVGGVFGLQGIKEFRNNATQDPIRPDDSTYNVVEPESRVEEDVNVPVKLP